ncbi:MAG TPA: DUF1223 domain-containing protein [Aliidongia sp.]|nr:DUF1223 domain-containing protein [Aliidongia sp.]
MTARKLLSMSLAAAGLLLPLAGHASERPILVELFTSQGCSSCPPADAILGELAKQPGVLALAWHVHYWDGLGWKDKFSSPEWTRRQYEYSARLGLDNVYTPQIVIDGNTQAVGSDAYAIARLISAASQREVAGPDLSLTTKPDGTASVAIGAGSGSGTVWLIGYDREQVTPVGRGENAGQTLTDYQVVRSAIALGDWNGKALDLTLPAKSAEGEMVFIEPGRPGPILAALDLKR